jgi:hypothetical protein
MFERDWPALAFRAVNGRDTRDRVMRMLLVCFHDA